MRREAPWGQRSGDNSRPCGALLLPEAFTSRSILAQGCMPTPGEGPRVGQVWEKKPDNWLEGRQTSGRTDPYKWLSSLFSVLLLTRGDAHTLSLWVCTSALPLFQLNKLSVFSHLLLCYVSNNKFVPAFTVLVSVINAFFTGGKDPGENSF